MKNITVSVPDQVYRHSRIRAAEQGRSVSSLVTEYLRGLSEDEAEFVRLEAQQEQVHEQIDAVRAGDRLERDALHARALR